MPMLVHQWAPGNGAYVPYVDFTSPITGTIAGTVSGGVLNMQLTTSNLQIGYVFRPEYNKVRQVSDPWIGTNFITGSVQDYINSTPYQLTLATWPITPQISLMMTDVQQWPDSLRIPLAFQSQP
jgi:hypothetical protein